MNAYLNYLLEANFGLCLFFVVYIVLLRHETDFRIKREIVLIALASSLLFPLLHIRTENPTIPTLTNVLPTYWLPGVTVGGGETSADPSYSIWSYIAIIYGCGVGITFILFIVRLAMLMRALRKSKYYTLGKYRIIESTDNQSSFSFFRYIFIGQADKLTDTEKQQIIHHETIHASQWHSFDILFINLLFILFWFNPLIILYKKIFVQLHEFEADSRAVENHDVNDYCSLLARVALLSADFKHANHFSNSLTVKRIEMMRTIKTKIKRWKFLAVALTLPLLFFFVACQDQVADDLAEIAKNSNHAIVVPPEVQARYEQLKRENPSANYIVLEFNEVAEKKLAEMEANYGLPKAIELYTPDAKDEKWIRGEAEGVIISPSNAKSEQHTFAIIQYNEHTKEFSNLSKQEGDVFTVVDKAPEYFENGFDGLVRFLGSEMKYPEEPRNAGIQGSVFVSFIVEKDGSVSDVQVAQGVNLHLDEEAVRVVKMTKWIPGQQNGENVRVRFVMPIKYKL